MRDALGAVQQEQGGAGGGHDPILKPGSDGYGNAAWQRAQILAAEHNARERRN